MIIFFLSLAIFHYHYTITEKNKLSTYIKLHGHCDSFYVSTHMLKLGSSKLKEVVKHISKLFCVAFHRLPFPGHKPIPLKKQPPMEATGQYLPWVIVNA